MRLIAFAPLLAAIASSATAAPPALEDLDAGKKAQPVDRRLRLVACTDGAIFEPPSMGAVTAYCPTRGWRVRVPLIGATTAEPAETVIRRGDTVQLAYVGPGFDVTTGGTALEDGRIGGVVRVKTPTGGASVTARVRGPGVVVIGD
jgi:flagellar basal body P-ring formation protein FlgA